jgi:biotin carboxyl carrier protein
MKKLRVTVDGAVFEVTVEIPDETGPVPAGVQAPASEPPPPPPAPPPSETKAPAGGPGDARSPLAGKLVSIDVQLGQTVTEGQQVATIEAMKMNTYVNAPKPGRIASILANPGDAVEEGATLLVIE